MSEMVSTLRHVCRLAAKAIEKDREYRCQPDAPSITARIEALPFIFRLLSGGLRAVPCPRRSRLPCLRKNIVNWPNSLPMSCWRQRTSMGARRGLSIEIR